MHFETKTTRYLQYMTKFIKVKKGLDLHLVGDIADDTIRDCPAKRCAIVPDDFPGLLPKLDVKEGDAVKAGDTVMHDKNHEAIRLTSPLSGTIEAIVRGARRKIERVIIVSGDSSEFRSFTTREVKSEQIRSLLQESGLWACIRQRPYDIVPASDAIFRDIFVTGFDSAPLAGAKSMAVNGDFANKGSEILSKITEGKVYVASRQGENIIKESDKVKIIEVAGPHPAGNVGVQIANVLPVNKDEIVATLDIVTLARIGEFFATGKVPYSTVVALTGSEVLSPQYVSTTIGAELSPILDNKLSATGHKRIISGNVLTGVKVEADGFLRFPYRHISVIPEGDDVADFLGWASLSPKKMSVNRSFPGHFLFKKRFAPDARILGGRRAMIMSGEYEKVFPMDILPEFLIKAILSENIEQMEKLGIYEVAPEDFALAEYVDSSKMELQKIVRDGLDFLRKELI